MFKKILVPTDGSEDAMKALEYAKVLSAKFGASITLLHVVQQYYYTVPNIMTPEIISISPTIMADFEKIGRIILEKTREQLKDFTGQVETRLEFGKASEVIVDTAAKDSLSLIVMGSRGLSGFEGLLIGSVSEQVVRHAPCPVLVVKKNDSLPE